MPTMSTGRFIYLRNLKLLKAQLMSTTDEAKSQKIVKLIEDEELKYRASTDVHAQRRGSKSLNHKGGNVPRPARVREQAFRVESGEQR